MSGFVTMLFLAELIVYLVKSSVCLSAYLCVCLCVNQVSQITNRCM